MNNKNIIIAGAIAVGLYLFSQTKKTAQRIRPTATPTIRQRTAQKIAQKIAQKVAQKRIGQPTTQAARIAAARRAAARKAAVRKAAVRKAAAQKIGKKVAQKVAQKRVAPWKAPYKFPKSRFRVITPSDILRNLAKKDIARKKAEQQKTAQKTTLSTPSARRKKRLQALYGSHWHQVWIQRPRRR